ncbi:MAG: hypothetical protein ACRENP_10575 [Longimicrobiales bacterium]
MHDVHTLPHAPRGRIKGKDSASGPDEARNDRDIYGSDFTDQLGGCETPGAGTQAVLITRGATKEFDGDDGRFEPIGPWTDVTSEFVSGSASISGAIVQCTLKKARGRAASTRDLRGVRRRTHEHAALAGRYVGARVHG